MKISDIWTDGLDFWGQAWWVEVLTTQPSCIYYFGPFGNAKEASRSISGYVEDLEGESAQGIQAQVTRHQPHRLTIDREYDRKREADDRYHEH